MLGNMDRVLPLVALIPTCFWMILQASSHYVEYLRDTKIVTGILCGALEGVPVAMAVVGTFFVAKTVWRVIDERFAGATRRA